MLIIDASDKNHIQHLWNQTRLSHSHTSCINSFLTKWYTDLLVNARKYSCSNFGCRAFTVVSPMTCNAFKYGLYCQIPTMSHIQMYID